MKLKGKVAVVTGGARDIGHAVSLKLAREGAKVVVNYYESENDARRTVEVIKKNGGAAISVYADVTKAFDVDNLVRKTRDNFGDEVDIIVNVAGGLFGRKLIDKMDDDYYNLLMNVNFKSVYLITKAFKPLLGKGSSIVNFASQAARDGGGPGASLYAAAKGAVMTFTRSMAKEFGPEGIRVNALCPGMISTRYHDDFTKSEVREKVASGTPLRREGETKEVADLVCYLVSEEASFITGINIDINGGFVFS